MPLIWAIVLLPVGIVILVKGADWLVDGAVAVAERLGVTPLVIGLTVVAMGTSAPEVAASIAAALADSGDIAVGNVYGSNIANLALVAGLCALIRPIIVHRTALRRDIPMMLAATAVLWPVFQNGDLSRGEAMSLLTFFCAFVAVMVYTERRYALADKTVMKKMEATVDKSFRHIPRSLGCSFLWISAGLVCLACGAHLTVLSASALGRAVGISEAVIGLTVVALGTSLPELTTCLVAAFKGHDDLSIGNLIGSNIFNALLVVGAAGIIKPFTVSLRLAGADFWPMAGVSVVFALFALFSKRISRPAGLILFVGYCGYIVWLFAINR